VLRESIAGICPALSGSVHLGTRGCVCDFTHDLSDAKLKVLSGFVCRSCSKALAAAGYPALPGEIREILGKRWIGSLSDPASTSSILAKLRSDLFMSTGLKPTLLENVTRQLQTEGVKAVLTVVTGVAIAGILIFLGWKVRG
jgi:hypothetical protein